MTAKPRRPRPRWRAVTGTVAASLAAVAALGLVTATINTGAEAKYVTGFSSAYKQADAAEFYFLTDLEPNDAAHPYPVYDGTIDFGVKNFDALNWAEKDIAYTVSLNGQQQSAGTLAGNTRSGDAVCLPTSSDGDYRVTVASQSPYETSIELYFRVSSHYADSFYTVTSHDGWHELDLYTGENDGVVTVGYGSLEPDSATDLTADWQAGSNATGQLSGLAPYGHYRLIFFGDITGSANPFALSQGGRTLAKGA